MGAVFWFSIFGFLVHVISSFPEPLPDEAHPSSSTTISPALQSIYEKWGIEKKNPRNLDKRDLEAVVISLVEKYEKVIEENNMLLSLLDVGEYIENLFFECWPEWAGSRKNNDFSANSWKILFLNLEHPRIRFLKRKMIAFEITEITFVRLMSLQKLRNKVAHAGIPMDKKNETYQNLFLTLSGKTKSLLQAIICDILNESSEPGDLNDDVQKKIENTINEQRQSYRLLKIPNLIINEDERDLKWGLGDLMKQTNPVACIANEYTEKTGYILFSNFKDAYTVWENRDSTLFRDPCKDSMVIIKASTGPFSNGGGCVQIEMAESDFSFVQNEIEKFVDLIPKKIERTGKPAPKTVIKGSNEETILVTSFFFEYFDIEAAMTAYAKYKNCFKSREPDITISMIRPLKQKGLKEVQWFTTKNTGIIGNKEGTVDTKSDQSQKTESETNDNNAVYRDILTLYLTCTPEPNITTIV